MTTTEHAALIDHGPACTRPAPALRLSWLNQPEAFCAACGRYAPLPIPGDNHDK